MHLRTVVSDLLRSKLQIQFHQYYQEDQKKDTQKWFPTYSHDKGRTWQRQNKMGNGSKIEETHICGTAVHLRNVFYAGQFNEPIDKIFSQSKPFLKSTFCLLLLFVRTCNDSLFTIFCSAFLPFKKWWQNN